MVSWLSPSPVIGHHCSLGWQEPHRCCQRPGSPRPSGWHPGEGAAALPKSRPSRPSPSLASPNHVYFSLCWQQSDVPGNCFKCLCSTWDHFNTLADGWKRFFLKGAMTSKSLCRISSLIYKILLRWLQWLFCQGVINQPGNRYHLHFPLCRDYPNYPG